MVFSIHAAERWFQRFPDKDFTATVTGMRKIGKNGHCKILQNNGVVMVVNRDGLVVTVY